MHRRGWTDTVAVALAHACLHVRGDSRDDTRAHRTHPWTHTHTHTHALLQVTPGVLPWRTTASGPLCVGLPNQDDEETTSWDVLGLAQAMVDVTCEQPVDDVLMRLLKVPKGGRFVATGAREWADVLAAVHEAGYTTKVRHGRGWGRSFAWRWRWHTRMHACTRAWRPRQS
jgi:hypothetical protein